MLEEPEVSSHNTLYSYNIINRRILLVMRKILTLVALDNRHLAVILFYQ